MHIRVERHDSDLGRWLLARWEPERLAGLVEGLWYFEGRLTHLRERHFPTGRAEIVVHLGKRYRHLEGARTEAFPQTCASGLLLGPDVIEAPPGRSAVLGIRLRPLGAFTVLGHPLERAAGQVRDPGAQGEHGPAISRLNIIGPGPGWPRWRGHSPSARRRRSRARRSRAPGR